MENQKNIEVVEETKGLKKIGTAVKANAKKIGKVALVAGVGIAGFALGKKLGSNDTIECGDTYVFEIAEDTND